jgi:hypothetical protein
MRPDIALIHEIGPDQIATKAHEKEAVKKLVKVL